MENWKEIHPDFTEELQKEWESRGFGIEECKKWIEIGMKVNDSGYCAWLRDNKKITTEKFLDFKNAEQLRKDYIDNKNNSYPTNFQIIQDVQNNSQNWRIDEVITEYDNFGKAEKKELALIHKSAQIGDKGEVFGSIGCSGEAFSLESVYLLTQRFNQEEIVKIRQVLNKSNITNIEIKLDTK